MADKTKTKKAKYKPSRYLGKPNIEKIQKQFLAVLVREAQNLLDESHKGPLSEKSSMKLHKYLKLIKDLDKKKTDGSPSSGDENPGEDPDLSDLSDETLKNMAKKETLSV